jgi:hypothetical protein
MTNQIIEKIKLKDDLRVLGFQVRDCSTGIGEAFENLVKRLPGGFDRSYYGISEMTEDGMIYKAAALENYEGEAEQYQCEKFMIEKGEYLAVTLFQWRKNLDSIKEIFHGVFQEPGVDKTKPCIEWYKNDDEMVCMVKLRPGINGFHPR